MVVQRAEGLGRKGSIEGVLLIDVAARGISLSTNAPRDSDAGRDHDCELVIAQSAVVPTREHRLFATRQDNQARIEFDIWEGESVESSKNRHLGKYAVVDLPDGPSGDVLVLVEITLDTDGTIRLGASELISGDRLQLEQLVHTGLTRADVARFARQFAEVS